MSELTAALATIEKFREITGCPAGVELQDWVKQLAAENMGLKSERVRIFNSGYLRGHESTVEGCYVDIHQSDIATYHEDIVAEISEEQTPATDRIVAAQRSAFVDEAVAKITESGALTFGDCIVALCHLREGAK